MNTSREESKFAPVLRRLRFEAPEGAILKDLIARSTFTPEDPDQTSRDRMIYSESKMFGVESVFAVDDVGTVWIAQQHVDWGDMDAIGFLRGTFSFQLEGAARTH